MIISRRAALWGGLAGMLVRPSYALAGIEGIDPEELAIMEPHEKWITAQKVPGEPGICCNLADGRLAPARPSGDVESGWKVLITKKQFWNGKPDKPKDAGSDYDEKGKEKWSNLTPDLKEGWWDVPLSAYIDSSDNPIGKPITWFVWSYIRCFCPMAGF